MSSPYPPVPACGSGPERPAAEASTVRVPGPNDPEPGGGGQPPIIAWHQFRAGDEPPAQHHRYRRVAARTLSKAWGDSLFGLSSQAAFWCALSTAPMLLALLGLTGLIAPLFGPATLTDVQHRRRPVPAARMSGSRYVHFCTRSLSIGAGVDHTTVAAHLRALREGPDALIELIDGNRGLDGDLYELVIPGRYADRAGRRDWRGGKLHALRPVFLELGIPAALVYEALEHATGPLTSFDLTSSVSLSRSAVYEALETLAAFHLAAQRRGRWILVTSTSLTALAEQLGVAETIHRQVVRHRTERAAYRLVLHIADRHRPPPPPPAAVDWYGRPPPQPPPDDDEESLTALSLLERILGARPVPA